MRRNFLQQTLLCGSRHCHGNRERDIEVVIRRDSSEDEQSIRCNVSIPFTPRSTAQKGIIRQPSENLQIDAVSVKHCFNQLPVQPTGRRKFDPGNLREARRQRNLPEDVVPPVCILDPDGDIVRHLLATKRARRAPAWACYHSQMHCFEQGGREYGIIGYAVGASYAVLLAEQVFASGCKLLLSVTSSGQISAIRSPPHFILIERALRDEGVSYHYLPPSDYAEAESKLVATIGRALSNFREPVERGATWRTDAPYRETQAAIEATRAQGVLAVEMEAAGLYAFAQARAKPVLCFAHVTNQMGQIGDFEKGEANGAIVSLALVEAAADAYILE